VNRLTVVAFSCQSSLFRTRFSMISPQPTPAGESLPAFDASVQQAALLMLSDRFRSLSDTADLAYAAGEILATTLNISRAGYGTIDPVCETITVECDWNAPGIESLAGLLHFRDYGSYIDDLKRGETAVVADARLDRRTAQTAAALEAISARAFVNMPVTERGGFVALLYLNHEHARVWSEAELGFIREVADRTRDAVERRRAEDELRRLNATLSDQVRQRTAERDALWEATPDLLSVATHDGRFLEINPAWTAMLGWSEAELKRQAFTAFIHPDDIAATGAAMGALIDGERVSEFTNRYRTKAGDYRWLSWNAVPRGDLIYAVVRDVTEAREQQEALHRTEEALRQAHKMEAVGQLTGGLAHDFNNLLAGISGSLEMIRMRLAQGRSADVERYLVASQGATKRAASLTHRLLAFSRRQTLTPTVTEVNRLVIGMDELIQRSMGPSIEVGIVTAAGLWNSCIDANQLENALLNLCINARDAMPEGGKLTIETGNRWLDDRSARERDLPPGQYISLCVSDTGTGMTKSVIERAFDPFYTTKPIGQGTGLGLSMVYGFARQSEGQVRIYSEVDQGTMVCIYLPRHLGEATADLPEQDQGELARGNDGETVLVVDDEPTVRMLVVDALHELGYVAIEAADGAGGLKVLQSDQRIDLLITDVGLPAGMNGRQLADAGRIARPGLRVLFITGYAENAVLSHGHLDPGMHVLTKPFAMDILADRIRGLIAT
jgi:PAS domain S-box-containing protein